MTASTALVVLGLLFALLGVGLALRARLRPGPAADTFSAAPSIDGFDDLLERAQDAYRATDSGLRAGVAAVVVGLLLAGLGAYRQSDAHALGTDVGGSGTTDRDRVGGTW